MKFIIRLALFALGLVSSSYPLASFASEKLQGITSNPLPGKMVYSGMTEDFPPFNFENNGKVTGFTTEVTKLVFKKAGLKVNFTLWPWSRSYNAALTKKGHFVFTTSRTADREKLFKWVGPIAKDEFYIAAPVKSKITPTDKFESLKDLRISGIVDDQPTIFLEKHGFKFIHTQDDSARGRLLKKGLLDIDVVSTSSHKHYEKIYGIKLKKISHLYVTDYYLAFNAETSDEDIEKLNKALQQIANGPEWKNLEKRFF